MKKTVLPYKVKNTTSLFFDKYVFKVTVALDDLHIASIFRGFNVKYIESMLKQLNNGTLTTRVPIDYVFVNQLFCLLTSIRHPFSVSVEWNRVRIYSNSEAFMNQIINLDKSKVVEFSKPKNDKIKQLLLTTKNVIIRPKCEFEFLLKIKTYNAYKKFENWGQSNPAFKFLSGSNSVYINNEKNLNLSRLYLGSAIQRIDSIVIESQIV